MRNEINKNKAITANSEQLAALKAQFPSCFDKDGRFRPDKLEDIVRASGADITREGYKLDWLGKSYARLLANLKTETLLAPNTEHNALPENVESENLLIQGDNLDVLKHLVNAYSEKVKMIYIDPPYNTGSDGFVYNDTRKFTVAELQRLAGVEEDEAKRILDFTQSSSNSHSAWLTFMYPRLYVARELLREDGVIFISIDDHEQAQLKLLCDEVFGEVNFVEQFSWQKTSTPTNLSKKTKKSTEYIFCYQRLDCGPLSGLKKNSVSSNGLMNQSNKISELTFPAHTTTTKLKDGKIKAGQYGTAKYEITLLQDATVKGEVFTSDVKLLGKFKWSQKYLDNSISDGVKVAISTSAMSPSYTKLEYGAEKPWNEINSKFGVGTNENATTEVDELFCENFAEKLRPKPTSLIEYLITTNVKDGDVVVDFFAGSGTTAHALMKLAASSRLLGSYVLVQLDEPIEESTLIGNEGYESIFEITRERIKRAAAKIKADNPDATCDFGFKKFKTIPANEGPFQGYLDDAATLEDYVPFNGMALDDEAITALLTTWKAYDGLPLHQDLVPVNLDGYTAYQGGDKLYFVDRGLEIKHIAALLARIDDDDAFTPRKIVVFHYRFNDKQLREFSEAVNAPNRKHLQLDFIQRF